MRNVPIMLVVLRFRPLHTCSYWHHELWEEKGAAGVDVCVERKTDCTGRDVCLAGEVNKIEAVL